MKKAAEDALEKAEAEKKAAEEEAARQKQIADEAQAALDKAAAEEAEQRQKEADDNIKTHEGESILVQLVSKIIIFYHTFF